MPSIVTDRPAAPAVLDVAVVGGGHGSYAAAADLADRGHRVRLWRRDTPALAAVRANGGLTLRDARGTRTPPLAAISDDIGPAVAGADLVVVALPAPAQHDVARTIAPHLTPNQVVLACPGSFGSFLMAQVVAQATGRSAPAFAESGTLPYLARKAGPATVAVRGRTTRLPTGVYPAAETDRALAVVAAAYPEVEPAQDALDAALLNAGPIIHPPLIVLNAAPIEHFDAWDIHAEGTQPGVRRVHDALDAERVRVREALGYPPPHFPLSDHYDPGGAEWMYGDGSHAELVDSGDWREPLDLSTHRYVREDVACGLALLVTVGEWAGVDTPVAAGLLAVASALVGDDLRATGRTWERTGLRSLSPAAVRELLRTGRNTDPEAGEGASTASDGAQS